MECHVSHLNSCCVVIKNFTAYLIKSSMVVSSSLIDKNAKHSVNAKGNTNQVWDIMITESNNAMQIIVKSLKDQSHRLAVALRFWGYRYVCFIFSLL